MSKDNKYFPLFCALGLGALACAIRSVLSFIYTDENGAFAGSTAVLYVLFALLIAALVLVGVASLKSVKGSVAALDGSGGFVCVFVYACAGFFQAFSFVFMVYAFFSKTEFFEYASTPLQLALMLASALTALLCFIKASGNEPSLKKSPFYPLLYLFPIAWSLLRLFVLFMNTSAKALYTSEKLQVLSLILLTVYFLYEARVYHSPKPVSLSSYTAVAVLTVVLVPLSALPNFLRSLFISESASVAEPIFCLVELAMCAFAAVSFAELLKTRIKNENR